MAKKIGQTLFQFAVSAILLRLSVIWVIVGMGIIALMAFRATIRLFELVKDDLNKQGKAQFMGDKTVEKIITLKKSHRMRKEGEMIK